MGPCVLAISQNRHGLPISDERGRDRCEIFDDPRFAPHADKYLNLLIRIAGRMTRAIVTDLIGIGISYGELLITAD
jgi:hypothetical protein